MTDRLYEEDVHLMDNGWLVSEVIMARFLLMAQSNLNDNAYQALLLLCQQMVGAAIKNSNGISCQFRPDSLEMCLSRIEEVHHD